MLLKKNYIMKNKKKLLYLLVYFSIFILLLLQHSVIEMYFDDFGNASLSYSTTIEGVAGTNFNFRQLLESASYTYFNYGGRILYGMFASVLLKNGIKPFMMLQVFVLLGIFYFISSVITLITKKDSVLYPIICMILYMLLDIGILRHGVYWASASILYVWPLLPFFAIIYHYMKTVQKVENDKEVNLFSYSIISIVLVFLAVFSQEQIGVALLSYFVIYILFHHIKEEKKYWKYDLMVIIPSIVVYLILFLAPGNWQRMAFYSNFYSKSFFEKIIYNYPNIINLFFKVKTSNFINILVSLLLMYLVLIFMNNYKKERKYYWLIIPILVLSVNYVLYDKQYYNHPSLLTFIGTIILLSMLLGLFIYYKKEKNLHYLSFFISGTCSVFCLLMSPYMVERSVLPCIFIMFIPIVSIGYKLFFKNKTIKVLIIILIIISAYYGLDNYFHIFIGYYKNYPIEVDNYKKLENYKKYKENNTISLCKIKNETYSSTQPYEDTFDYWIQQYFDLPYDLVMEWNDCNEKN